jgi:hypothetical protein
LPYLSDHSHDVFISYAHGPKAFAGYQGIRADFLSEWTRTLVDDLSGHLDFILGTKDEHRRVSVWMDPAFNGNSPLSEGLRAKISQSALLVVVMSKFYLESRWCSEELAWFSNHYGKSSGDRIFVVKAYNTPAEGWSEALRPGGDPLPGYHFYSAEDPNSLGRPLGWPQRDVRGDKSYWEQLWKLADEIASQLKRIEWMMNAGATSPGAIASRQVPSVPARVGRTLFLGYTHDSLIESRYALREHLDMAGFKIVPPVEEDPVDEATVRSAFEKYLPASEAVILVGNQNSELWPRGQNGGPLGLQLQLAQQHRVPIHLWILAKDLSAIRNPQYRTFLANLDASAATPGLIIHTKDIESFVQGIGTKLDAAPKRQREESQFAVVWSNRGRQTKYEDFETTITDALRDTGRTPILADRDDGSGQIRLMEVSKELSRADTVVVVCFDQDWIWAQSAMLQLSQIMEGQGDKTGILVTGPEYKNKGKIVPAKRFKTVVGVTPDNHVANDQVAGEIKRLLSQAA